MEATITQHHCLDVEEKVEGVKRETERGKEAGRKSLQTMIENL